MAIGKIKLNKVLTTAFAFLAMAGLLAGCPIQTYDDAESEYRSGGGGGTVTPPPGEVDEQRCT